MRIALYGDVNLNLIDGSAIWLVALAETLALDPRCHVTVVLKSPIDRDLVVAPLLGRDNVELVTHRDAPKRLTPAQALDTIEEHDQRQRFDVVLLRGFELCKQAAARPTLAGRLWVYLTDIPQQPHLATDEDKAALGRIALASQRVLCQTDELRAYLEGLVPETAWRTSLLTPMVPESFLRPARELSATPKLFYAGKFAPAWGFLETVEAFTQLRKAHPDLELHVAGDKIHDPPDDPSYKPAVQAALEGTEGLVWHGAVSRERVAELLVACDVALSARHASMDASLELSTKVLEYGAANVPAVINRNPLHERLFGGDYPLFIDHLDDLAAVLDRTLSDADAWRAPEDTAHEVAQASPSPGCASGSRRRWPPPGRRASARWRAGCVVTGHDLKFTGPLVEMLRRAGAEVREDRWHGHTGHDAKASEEALAWADAIWAEWCLGNAVWYADRRRPDQRMVVRLHRQELETDFPLQVDHDAVDRLVCVAPFVAEAAKERFGWRGRPGRGAAQHLRHDPVRPAEAARCRAHARDGRVPAVAQAAGPGARPARAAARRRPAVAAAGRRGAAVGVGVGVGPADRTRALPRPVRPDPAVQAAVAGGAVRGPGREHPRLVRRGRQRPVGLRPRVVPPRAGRGHGVACGPRHRRPRGRPRAVPRHRGPPDIETAAAWLSGLSRGARRDRRGLPRARPAAVRPDHRRRPLGRPAARLTGGGASPGSRTAVRDLPVTHRRGPRSLADGDRDGCGATRDGVVARSWPSLGRPARDGRRTPGRSAAPRPEIPREVDAACGRAPQHASATSTGPRPPAGIDCIAWWDVAGGFPDGTYRGARRSPAARWRPSCRRRCSGAGSAAPAPGVPSRTRGHPPARHRAAGRRRHRRRRSTTAPFRPGSSGDARADGDLPRRAPPHVLGEELPDEGVTFPDVEGTTHELAIRRIASAGITRRPSGNYRPDDPVTRGQLGSFVARLLDRAGRGRGSRPWPRPPRSTLRRAGG
jgi:glycosyltransferase involved in cell wall biosynthesis